MPEISFSSILFSLDIWGGHWLSVVTDCVLLLLSEVSIFCKFLHYFHDFTLHLLPKGGEKSGEEGGGERGRRERSGKDREEGEGGEGNMKLKEYLHTCKTFF